MKKARMNISHCRSILFKLKIFGEIVTTKLKTVRASLRDLDSVDARVMVSQDRLKWEAQVSKKSEYGYCRRIQLEKNSWVVRGGRSNGAHTRG